MNEINEIMKSGFRTHSTVVSKGDIYSNPSDYMDFVKADTKESLLRYIGKELTPFYYEHANEIAEVSYSCYVFTESEMSKLKQAILNERQDYLNDFLEKIRKMKIRRRNEK